MIISFYSLVLYEAFSLEYRSDWIFISILRVGFFLLRSSWGWQLSRGHWIFVFFFMLLSQLLPLNETRFWFFCITILVLFLQFWILLLISEVIEINLFDKFLHFSKQGFHFLSCFIDNLNYFISRRISILLQLIYIFKVIFIEKIDHSDILVDNRNLWVTIC